MLVNFLREVNGGVSSNAAWPTQRNNCAIIRSCVAAGPFLRSAAPCFNISRLGKSNDSFAVSLVAAPAAGDLRAHAKEFASAWIAELKVDRRVPHAQAAAWATSNAVFAETTHNENMFAK